MKNHYYTIGSKKQVMGGIEYIPKQTENGFVYKSQKVFKTGKGICYICESAFRESKKDTLLITPENYDSLARSGGIYTARDIYSEVAEKVDVMCDWLQNVPDFVRDEFIKREAEMIFDELDWSSIGVLIDDWDFDEDWDAFCQEKKARFETIVSACVCIYNEINKEEIDEDEILREIYNAFGEDCFFYADKIEDVIDGVFKTLLCR